MAHASPWALHVKARLLQRAGQAFEHVDHEACSAGAALAGGAAPGPKSPQIAKSCFEGALWKHALGKRGEARDALNRAVAVDPLPHAPRARRWLGQGGGLNVLLLLALRLRHERFHPRRHEDRAHGRRRFTHLQCDCHRRSLPCTWHAPRALPAHRTNRTSDFWAVTHVSW